MKRSILTIAAIYGFVLMFSSCKKDYECSCHTSTGGHEHIEMKTKPADAESECKAKAVGTYTACELE